MASRRVRRDSETSTDSWSLVEEDRLDDDFSLNSTEAEEEYENDEVEPIVEEPPSTDEDTASEDSDSDCDSDSDSDLSENSELDDSASEISQSEEERQAEMEAEAVEESEEEEEEEEEDSEDEEDEEKEEENEEDVDEEEEGEMTEEEKKAARMCKEDEEWIDEEEEEENDSLESARHYLRVFLFISAFFLVFPIAEICTSWVLTYQSHRALPRPTLIFDYSPQRYNFENGRYARKVREGKRYSVNKKWATAREIFTPLAEHLLKTSINTSWSGVHNIFTSFDNLRSVGKPIVIAPELKKFNNTIILPIWAQTAPKINTCSKSDQKPTKFLAPVPPAPFTPRKNYRSWTNLPRYQPCLVHVNESKWTCQKTSIQKKSTSLSVLPRKFDVSKRKIYKKKDLDGSNKKFFKQEICGKKASQSMRTTVSKPKDQCDSRHVSKYTPKRYLDFHRIEYKSPLPCQLPTYRPTMPKPSKKPSKSADDWFSRRGHVRAQLRSRA